MPSDADSVTTANKTPGNIRLFTHVGSAACGLIFEHNLWRDNNVIFYVQEIIFMFNYFAAGFSS